MKLKKGKSTHPTVQCTTMVGTHENCSEMVTTQLKIQGIVSPKALVTFIFTSKSEAREDVAYLNHCNLWFFVAFFTLKM